MNTPSTPTHASFPLPPPDGQAGSTSEAGVNSSDRIKESIAVRIETRAGSECWWWIAKTNAPGYGMVKVNGKYRSAHRTSYEVHVGPIPAGLMIRHLCHNRLCVNPKHLKPGTAQDNADDNLANNGSRSQARKPRIHHFKLHPEWIGRGWKHPNYRRADAVHNGEKHPQAKLTEESVLAIRKRKASGETFASLAREYGVSWVAAYKAGIGETWKHIKGESK